MTAEEIITILTTGNPNTGEAPGWIKQAALIIEPSKYGKVYDTTAVNFFSEVTVRVPTVKTARRTGALYQGLQRRRMDLVALVQPHYKHFEPFVLGVEIKVSEYDLAGDDKLAAYLDYCHLFYLAVPVDIVEAALVKIATTPALAGCGLIGLSSGKDPGEIRTPPFIALVSAPHKRKPSDRCLAELYAELLIRPFKVAGKECKTFINFERRP